MTKAQQSEREKFTAQLRETLKPGDKVYTVLRSVSRSGMSRVIDVFFFSTDEHGQTQKQWLSYWIAKACGMAFQDRQGLPEGIKIGGCGMDMGFAIVYDLGRTLWPEGFGVEGTLPLGHVIRPATVPNAAKAVRAGATFRGRNGDASGWDTDGGYALHHEWL